MTTEDSDGRPLQGPATNADDTKSQIIPRCTHCGHVIWSVLSVELGVGAECRRRAA